MSSDPDFEESVRIKLKTVPVTADCKQSEVSHKEETQPYVLNLQDQGMLNDAAAARMSQDTKEPQSSNPIRLRSDSIDSKEKEKDLPEHIHIQFKFASNLDNAKSSMQRRSRASSNSYE